MQGAAPVSCVLMVGLALLVQGCLSPPSNRDALEQQQALARLNACLEREASDMQAVSSQAPQPPSERCRGYIRDVLHTYPHHYSTHVERMLNDPVQRPPPLPELPFIAP